MIRAKLKWLRTAALVLPCCVMLSAGAIAAATPLPQAHLSGNYFSRDGHSFLVVGAHWIPAKAAMAWPVEWDPKDIEADFAKMAEMGFNTVRIDLLWAWFEPRPGDYSPKAFEQFDFLISLAHKYHLYLQPTLFIGGEVGEAWWDVPWRMGRDPQSDPEMLRLQTNLAQEFGRRYAKETAIQAWDLTDEPPYWISKESTTDAMAINWTRLIAGGIRKYDKMHPIVVGVSTEDIGHGPFRPDNIVDDVDFLSVHPYTIYTPDLFPDPMVSERGTYGAAFETTLSSGAGKPVMVQELGASSAQYSPQKIAQYLRANLYSALGAGTNGFLLWCFTDAAPGQYAKVPYLRSPHETQFGLTTWDRKMRPQGEAFEEFEKVVARMNLDGVSPVRGDAAILIPEEWSRAQGDYSHFGLTGPSQIPYVSNSEGGAVNGQAPRPYDGNQWVMSSVLSSYILAHRAGLKAELPRELTDWSKHPMVLLPSPLTATDPVFVHLHTDFWPKAEAYVRGGGVLYASLAADGAIPHMTDLFGARMTDSVLVSELTLKIVKPFGSLKPGDSLSFTVPGMAFKYAGTGLEVNGGEVIAVDQQGRPALVANKLGKGRTLLSAYPLEAWLGNQPMAFENNDTAYRLYKALREWGGVQPLAATDDPSVEASVLNGHGRGYIVLANHGGQDRSVSVTSKLPIHALRQIKADGSVALNRGEQGWMVNVPAYGGAVLEWRN